MTSTTPPPSNPTASPGPSATARPDASPSPIPEPMRSVEAQLDLVLAAVRRLDTELVTIDEALGRTLAEPLTATVPIPVFDNSAMDGFAVRRDDLHGQGPWTLRVTADVPAGSAEDPALGQGEAARIMTGAPMPSTADAVVQVEHTAEGFDAEVGGTVTVTRAPKPAAHIRRIGEDAPIGAELLPSGVELGPLQLSALAAAGRAKVRVARRPRVLVVSTGTELVPPGAPLARGEIPESNSFVLAGLAATAGAEVIRRTSVPDDPAVLVAELSRAFGEGVDAVLMSGGVSEGAYEPVKQALSAAGGTGAMAFAKVAMQPGKPQGFGVTAGGVLLFGFPGNPVSVAVSFECFARPALLAMQGRASLERPRITLPAAVDWRPPVGRRQYLPATIDRTDPGRWTVRPAHRGGSGSHMAGGLARAEAIAVVPAEVEAVRAGDPIDVMLVS